MKTNILISLVLLTIFFSCKKEDSNANQEIKTYSVNGLIQKGPFVNGTTITISELNNNLAETGKVFHTTITDDKGSFEIPDLELESDFVHIRADGYFFNEIVGDLTNSRIILDAIVNLQENQNINVNIITSLESMRVNYLVQNDVNFENAKIQARNEVFDIFGFSISNEEKPETFDITGSGENNSILLAISVITLGTNTPAELTNLISGISIDIREDGILDSEELQSELINEATLLNAEAVRNNFLARYQYLGEDVSINNFEQYVDDFVNTSDFRFTKNIIYPGSSYSLLNVISDTVINYTGAVKYCIAAYLPEGTKCTVIYKVADSVSGVGIFSMQNEGWTINVSSSDSTNLSAIGQDEVVSIPFMLGPPIYPGRVDFFIYENGSDTPAFTKVIEY